MMYPDSLGQSVNSYEMSEAKAQRRRIDFRTALADTERPNSAREHELRPIRADETGKSRTAIECAALTPVV